MPAKAPSEDLRRDARLLKGGTGSLLHVGSLPSMLSCTAPSTEERKELAVLLGWQSMLSTS